MYLGYTLAFYAMFYEINHVLLMGRVTSGEGGDLVLAKAQEVLRTEYPQLKIAREPARRKEPARGSKRGGRQPAPDRLIMRFPSPAPPRAGAFWAVPDCAHAHKVL